MSTYDPTPAALQALAELAARPQWVCWRWEKREGEAKVTKPPRHPDGWNASSTDAATWSTMDAVKARLDEFDGIGFAMGEDDPYLGIDLDRCLDANGVMAPWALKIVDLLDSYTEITPSNEGLRIWLRGRLPGHGRKKTLPDEAAIEVYDRGRYLTVTGRHWPSSPATIATRQAELEAFMTEIFPEPIREAPRPAPSTPRFPLDLPDAELISRAKRAANGPKFRRLWEGDTGDYDGDESRADLALCAELYFWTRGDRVRMDRLFRQSDLMREKWDERRGDRTYGEMTLDKALSGGGPFYEPSTNGREPTFTFAPPTKPPRPAAAPPQISTAGPPPVDLPPPIHNTDLGNARRLVAQHGAEMRFSFALGWLTWQPGHWEDDTTGSVVRRAKDTVGAMYEEAARSGESGRKELAKWALDSESAGKIGAMLELAKTEAGICVRADQFDADPMLLNCENGTVELRTGTLRPHDRADLLTKMVPTRYDPAATCPRWEQFLAELFEGDESRIQFVQRAIGYSLTGDTREQCLFFLTGQGSNGKSTFLGVLRALLGDYAGPAALGLLLENKNEQHPTGIADLAGKRLVTSVEVGEGRKLAEELVKQLTGQDPLKARKMHRDFFEFMPAFKLWLAANHKPNVRGTDHAIWRRIHTIPFNTKFYEPEDAAPGQPVKDKTLPEALAREFSGILAWAVRGCLEWQRHGLRPPAIVKNATEDYREEMDVLGGFLADRCIQQPTVRAASGALYAAYQEWCKATGEQPLTQTAFGRKLSERGFAEARDRNIGRMRLGIGLVDQTTEGDPRLSEA